MILKMFTFIAAQFDFLLIKKEDIGTHSTVLNVAKADYDITKYSREAECKKITIDTLQSRCELISIKVEDGNWRTTNITGSINIIDPAVKI